MSKHIARSTEAGPGASTEHRRAVVENNTTNSDNIERSRSNKVAGPCKDTFSSSRFGGVIFVTRCLATLARPLCGQRVRVCVYCVC